jgi:exodeoxyribonuclease VIII
MQEVFMTLEQLIDLNKKGQLAGKFFPDVDDEVYHHPECPGISKSGLDIVHRSVSHWEYSLTVKKEPTPAMLIGSAFHDSVLKPDLFKSRYIIMPEFRTTNADKAAKAEFVSKNNGKRFLDQEDYDRVLKMRDAILSHPKAKLILKDAVFEEAFWWTDPFTNILCKCKTDIRRKDGIIADLKSSSDASFLAFTDSIWRYNYDKQGGMYLSGVETVTGIPYSSFIFIVVEKEAPFCVQIFDLGDETIKFGKEMYLRDLRKLCEDTHQNKKGYSPDIIKIELSQWKRQEDNR